MNSDALAHAEVSAVACAIARPEAIAAMGLDGGQFLSQSLGRLWDEACKLADKGAVDVIAVAQAVGLPVARVAHVVEEGMIAAPDSYATLVRDGWHRRQAAEAARRIENGESPDDVLPALLSTVQPRRAIVSSVSDAIDAALASIDRGEDGLKTGFLDWDANIGPLGAGHVFVVGARPRIGKTAWAINLCLRCEGRSLFVSSEQPQREIALRALSVQSSIPATAIKRRLVQGHSVELLRRARTQLDASGFTIAEMPSPSLAEVVAQARSEHYRTPLSLIVVDYLQHMARPNKESAAYEIGANIRGLKRLAMELQIPVVVLAQVGRHVDQRENKRPDLSDFRDSGEIEQEADLAAFLYRDSVYRDDTPEFDECEVIVAKNRHGPEGFFRLQYVPDRFQFKDVVPQRSVAA